MIQLGEIQKLQVIRRTSVGVYLNSASDRTDKDILLPKSQVPLETEIGDEIEVFVYNDSEDRRIATVNSPKLTVGELAVLKAVETAEIGAFLDWGLEKDLFLPFAEQTGPVIKDNSYLVGLYIDNSDRLCATMKVYDMLAVDAPYKAADRVPAIIYSINPDFGAFAAVAGKYHGMIHNKELYGKLSVGDKVEVRIKRVRQDGKLELSLRQEAFNEIEGDAQKIMNRLKAEEGRLPFNDSSSPELIKTELCMSKAAFKRAVGRLLKEGAIRITGQGIELTWKK